MFPPIFFSSIPFFSEILMSLTFLTANVALLLAFRLWGAIGIVAYGVVAVIAATLQVLKISPCAYFPEPVALGTVVFSSLYLCSDILTEFYGVEKAKKAIWVHLGALILFMVWMLITVVHPKAPTPCQAEIQDAMEKIFLPIPSLVVASLLAYMVSQYNDIWIFATLKRLTKSQYLWLRTSLSNLASGFVDHITFSFLAWVVFAHTPMDWDTFWWSYIWGTYTIRALILLLHTPMMYVARKLRPTTP
ncbi:MAG: queuosine precursor transporter [Alphaproteobacteria bacterium]